MTPSGDLAARPAGQSAPLLSIITATYNAEKYIADLVASIRPDMAADIEWIVIDGASTDNTGAILQAASDVVTTFTSEPDKGIYDAWNKGIACARGEWVLFMGADDFFLPGGLQLCRAAANSAAPETNIITSTIQWIDENDGRLVKTIDQKWNWQAMQRWMTIAHPSTLHRRSIFKTAAPFDTSYRSAADYDFLLRVGPELRAGHIAEPVARVRIGGASHRLSALKEAQRARRKNLNISALDAGTSLAVATLKFMARKALGRIRL